MGLIEKVFGTKNDRELKKLKPRVQAIGEWADKLKKWDDPQLEIRISELKEQVQKGLAGYDKKFDDLEKAQVNAVLDPVLEETFAIVREAGRRVLGMSHYDVQLIGGMVLNSGRIAEMKTGEGKTLMATAPCVLNALTGQSVHLVTVNDYLASRDAEWMGRIYGFLGLSTGVVYSRQGDRLKRTAYDADITYGQNNEFGFDYLRDNMKFALTDYKQRGHAFCVVDEVDSILIDEARTPLIISGPAEDKQEAYKRANAIVPQLRKDEHYTIDEKSRNVMLTETGVFRCEQLLGIENLYDPTHIETLHHVSQALKAHTIYKRDADYVVNGGEVVIVDEHTGRLMPGRRWSDGLHGAIEAKENVKVQKESVTLATITFQNYFRMYKKLSGMTGTADTEAEEFAKIYDLDVVVIPTNRPIQRDDQDDLIYKTEREKVAAVVDDIVEHNQRQNPILVGTTSVEKSEVLSKALKRKGIDHDVLNAKRHKEEAAIVAQAGKLGKVTIATNMAGRGTDILLGGSAEFKARQEAARAMGDHEPGQVSEYSFLSGRPDLINCEAMALRDKKGTKYIREYRDRLAELREEAAEKGETFTIPDDMAQNESDARDKIYFDRLAFYQEAVKHYEAHLDQFDAESKAEKAKVLEVGGLRIIGTERHESRRIDNQLRGRAGRQGDPGSSRFYLSLEDDLMRIFGTERMINIMEKLGMEDGVPIEHKMVTKAIENAQKRVEGMHFDSRKNIIEYDDVMNQQRKAIYSLRRAILEADPSRDVAEGESAPEPEIMREMIFDLVEESIVQNVMINCPEKTAPAEWKVSEIESYFRDLLGVSIDLSTAKTDRDDIMDKCFSEMERYLQAKEDRVGASILGQLSAFVYLQTIDVRWKEHLQIMDHLREGIHLRGYGQKDPKQEYKKEGYNIFTAMRARIREETIEKVFRAEISAERDASEAELERLRRERKARRAVEEKKLRIGGDGAGQPRPSATPAPRPGMGGPSAVGPGFPTSVPTGMRPGPSGGDAGNRAQRRRAKSKDKKRAKLR